MLGAAFLLHTAARNILVLAITHRNTSQRECLGGCFREGRQGIFEKGFEIGGKERERCFCLAGTVAEKALPPARMKWWERAKGAQRIE